MHVLVLMKSAADVSPADEGRVAREHAVLAPVDGACGDGNGRSKSMISSCLINHD
jgi:hypothetical protein